ncbi:putative ABC transport system permease protein [Alkalibacterium putridalgicola]|uniref:ABC transporter permease n=1 Tax=Alkalibacterium putridalgicola TaxID=426703 RepID=A0A1H7WJE9_9LACT|nr:ABC transporter permease [Alkalibacterium putridalgicola]GEK88546.1 ABC transporter permease [Alkalibacterium putridalgicola]SEM21742.1 putative ABC transport system permease protein [Alkalibacterium putridalgicola]
MKISFFSKMAWRNIKSNRKLYIPYSISSVLSVALFQMMASLMTNDFVRQRSSTLPTLFGMGTVVIGLFSVIFIFYVNSFLMKRRKKEIGLYSVLGLEKRHVAHILVIENIMVSGLSILAGILVGVLFGRLSFLFLNYLLNLPNAVGYSTSWGMTGVTALLFIGIFTLTLLYNIAQVTFSNPIRLLKGGKEGEKEPKSSPILFVIGVLSLGAGYYISLTIDNPISAISQFFIAVLLVIIGTYLLFTTGSIVILKALKRNKAFYYRPGPFISISGMLYRMKQHAVGLANISILSVMVIIAVSTTITLYAGTEETLNNRFPEENNLSIMTDDEMNSRELKSAIQTVQGDLNELSSDEGYTMTDQYFFRYVTLWGEMEGQTLAFKDFQGVSEIPLMVLIMPVDDYNRLAEDPVTLRGDELLYYAPDPDLERESLTLFDKAFDLKQINNMPGVMNGMSQLIDPILLVTPDDSTLDTIRAQYNSELAEYPVTLSADFFWSLESSQNSMAYASFIHEELRENDYPIGLFYESRDGNREEWYSTNGGFLFIGIFLGGLFTIGAVLITYYKQISEGYEDRERIQIMQKVGLDKETTRQATHSQILWMFTLPILTAALHTAFAYPIVQKLLLLFGITSNTLFLLTTIGVVMGYSLIYWIIYRITSKLYLNIVE